MLTRYLRALPWDGLGWTGGPDPVLSEMRCQAAAAWRRRRPVGLRPTLWLADRMAWPLAAMGRTIAFARALGLDAAAAGRIYGDCVLTGGDPLEVHVWRSLHGGCHPLPARSAGLVLARLGDPAGHALLADKLATAERLTAAGGVFPALLGLRRRGEESDPVALTAAAGTDLFLKPRRGHGGRGAFALTRRDETWLADGRPIQVAALRERLERLSRQDDLLVQARLAAAPGLANLAVDGKAPVLRLATARRPGEAPFLHSALLTIAVPGRNPRHFLEGAVHAPVDPADGTLAFGLSLASPHERLERLDWNGALLAGRRMPGFEAATTMALHVMAALPALPLVHWDIILTATGPVLLEGNSVGNWVMANLAGAFGLDAGPLAPLLACWQQVERV